MLDLFAGLGGASAAMRARGWDVTTLELDPRFGADLSVDIRKYQPRRGAFDFVWASPPCTEFSRESMPWCRTGKTPSMALVRAALRVIRRVRPRFWAIENTRGAIKWFRPVLGEPRVRAQPVFVWGDLPSQVPSKIKVAPFKEKLSGKNQAGRSKIPENVSMAVARGIEDHFAAAPR